MKPNIKGCIFSATFKQQREDNNHKEFIVEIDTHDEDYLESLLNVVNKYKDVNIWKANKVRYGDFLVFTNKNIYVKRNNIYGKSYSLVLDYYKIKSLVEELYKKDSNNLPHKDCKDCPYYKSAKRNLEKDILFDGDFIDIDEKLSIFNNFVKIGYDTYDIYNERGKKYVDIDDNEYEVIVNDIFFVPPKKESICSKVKKCLKICR
jgi:hypothetical protein